MTDPLDRSALLRRLRGRVALVGASAALLAVSFSNGFLRHLPSPCWPEPGTQLAVDLALLVVRSFAVVLVAYGALGRAGSATPRVGPLLPLDRGSPYRDMRRLAPTSDPSIASAPRVLARLFVTGVPIALIAVALVAPELGLDWDMPQSVKQSWCSHVSQDPRAASIERVCALMARLLHLYLVSIDRLNLVAQSSLDWRSLDWLSIAALAASALIPLALAVGRVRSRAVASLAVAGCVVCLLFNLLILWSAYRSDVRVFLGARYFESISGHVLLGLLPTLAATACATAIADRSEALLRRARAVLRWIPVRRARLRRPPPA